MKKNNLLGGGSGLCDGTLIDPIALDDPAALPDPPLIPATGGGMSSSSIGRPALAVRSKSCSVCQIR